MRNQQGLIFRTLVTNAVKYGAPNTPLRIQISESNERLLLAVHNEGDPIPPNEQESIFLIFERSHTANQHNSLGWGIGLPFVRAVAERHGGAITVDSSVERGTTFVFDIPRDSRPFQDSPAFQDRRENLR